LGWHLAMSSRRHETTELPKSLSQAAIGAGEKETEIEDWANTSAQVEEGCEFLKRVVPGNSEVY
jgi:hypothetical protein